MIGVSCKTLVCGRHGKQGINRVEIMPLQGKIAHQRFSLFLKKTNKLLILQAKKVSKK